MCLGPWIGLTGVAWGVGACHVVYAGVMIFVSTRATGCSAPPVLRGLAGPLAASGFAGAVAWIYLRDWGNDVTNLAVSLGLGAFAYCAAVALCDRKHLVSDLEMLRNVIGLRRRAVPAA